MVQIGRFDIIFSVTSLKRFSADPWEGRIKQIVKISGYLQDATGRRKVFLY